MWIVAIVIVLLIIWLYRKPTETKKSVTQKVDIVKRDLGQLKSEVSRSNSNIERPEYEEDVLIQYLEKPRTLYQPDSASNAGRINYGAAVLFDNAPGLSSGEIEGQLPLVSRQNLMFKIC
jgi:hypothetical protein